MSHYFEKAKFFLYVTLRNLVNECDERFASVTLTSWVIVIVLIWSVIYLVYRKVFDVSSILCYNSCI
jgi:TRAP-type mannitol/chloroaromatic compound transport system permease small subunit